MNKLKDSIVRVDVNNINTNDIIGYCGQLQNSVCLARVEKVETEYVEIIDGNEKCKINKENIIIHYKKRNLEKI